MTIHHISKNNSVLNQFLIEIRDQSIQQDRWRFRQNLERIGELLAYEASKHFKYKTHKTQTVLGENYKPAMDEDIVICSILRAGLPMHNGVARIFDHQDHAFISAYRTYNKSSDSFDIHIEYCATPKLDNKTLILVDPMLATGHSLSEVYKALSQKYKISKLHILAAIASKPGLEYLEKHCPKDTHLWVADVDDILNDKGYIVPGLGDAGDLAFGGKV